MSALVKEDRHDIDLREGSSLSWYHYALMIIAPVAALVFVWEEYLEDRFIARNFGVVREGEIFRSGQLSPSLIEDVLLDNKIKVIIDLNGLDEGRIGEFQKAELSTADRLGVEVHRFPLKGDGTGNVERYADAIELMQKCVVDKKPVLVHCAAGAQRTGGVVASYRMLVEGKSAHEAVEELCIYESRRHKNEKVVEYVNEHVDELAKILAERKVIAEVPIESPVMLLR